MPSAPKTSSIIRYRPDIDGLRAVAVLQVLAYHLQVRGFRGGFVGVDVFFVISGFLISSLILTQISESKFSILSFYERRIRRIFPALIVMLIITSLLAYTCLLPKELLDFAKSLLAATFSVSNIYFWKQSGYFDAPAAMKPLLHTWSLAVEEQFYIAFPLFLVLVRRCSPKKLPQAVILVATVSFAASAVGAFKEPVTSFYLVHTRAWELLLGTILSLKRLPELRGPVQRNVAAAAGLIMIGAAGHYFTTETPFPGLAALAPCLGASLIIAAGQTGGSLVSRGLSLRPMVFIGLISYSLYLWHWPIIVLHGIETLQLGSVSGKAVKAWLLIVSLTAATVSWRFIEAPFRSGRFKLTGTRAFKAALAGATIVSVIGSSVLIFRGIPSRLPAEAMKVATYEDEDWTAEYRDGSCFISSQYKFENFDSATCLRESSTKKNYVLLGDSHAAQLWYGLSKTLDGANLLQATASGCVPTIEQSAGAADRCRLLMEYMFRSYLPAHHVDALFLAGRWSSDDVPRLSDTIAWTKQLKIQATLFGPMVQYDVGLPRLLAISIWKGTPDIPYEHLLKNYEELDHNMRDLAENQWHVRYISFFDALCGPAACLEYAGSGIPLQSDYGHLTPEGSVLLAQRLRQNRELP